MIRQPKIQHIKTRRARKFLVIASSVPEQLALFHLLACLRACLIFYARRGSSIYVSAEIYEACARNNRRRTFEYNNYAERKKESEKSGIQLIIGSRILRAYLAAISAVREPSLDNVLERTRDDAFRERERAETNASRVLTYSRGRRIE